MQPFDIEIGDASYAVFPEGNNTYTIFKNGKEYAQIQKDTESIWLKLDEKTETPLFEENAEINEIGKQIEAYKELPEEDEDEEDFEE